MGFSNKVIQQAMREQMRGRVPDLNRIKREQQEAERKGKLECSWDKDKNGKLFYGVYLRDLYDKRQLVYKFYNTNTPKANMIKGKIEQYNATHRQLLSTMSRFPSTELLKRLHKDFEIMFPPVNLAPDEKVKSKGQENSRK